MDKQEKSVYDQDYYLRNKERIKSRVGKYQKEHREWANEKGLEWRKRNIETARRQQRDFYYRNKESILTKRKVYQLENAVRLNARSRELSAICRAKKKYEVLTYYGGGDCHCVYCNEDRIDCLSIDHINNNGEEHRKTLSFQGSYFYQYLKKQGFPDGYQTLCMNCQFIKKAENQRSKRGITSRY